MANKKVNDKKVPIKVWIRKSLLETVDKNYENRSEFLDSLIVTHFKEKEKTDN